MARQKESVAPGRQGGDWEDCNDPDDPTRLRAQLARMSEDQLRRLLVWLDQRGAAAGRTFAVHQADPGDPASRDLIELRVAGSRAAATRPRLRLARVAGRPEPLGQAARA